MSEETPEPEVSAAPAPSQEARVMYKGQLVTPAELQAMKAQALKEAESG